MATRFRAVWLVLMSLAAMSVGSRVTGGIDYQKSVAGARWGWVDEMATPLWCMSQAGEKYDITLRNSHDSRYQLQIEISADGRRIYRWMGHVHSVFRILDDRLYYADFKTSGSGGDVVAVDLSTGKELWRSELKALGPIKHSAYHNLINLDANREVVTVFGLESGGRYLEMKNCEDGRTLAHRVFADEGQKEPKKSKSE